MVFGLGYTAIHWSWRLQRVGADVFGTVRTPAKARHLAGLGITARLFSAREGDPEIAGDIRSADAILVSIPPNESGDPVLNSFADCIGHAGKPRWIGYLSTVGVYGDHAGSWVDEATPTAPTSVRSRYRVDAEQAWYRLGAHVFRLSGIYGKGRNQLVQLAAGTAKRIVKPGQVFNRIHVADIAAAIEASLSRPRPGAIYNVSDNEPSPPQDVVEFAAKLCGIEPPPEIPFDLAELSPMSRSFYSENRRVRNTLIRDELCVQLKYPTYREGLRALWALGAGNAGV